MAIRRDRLERNQIPRATQNLLRDTTLRELLYYSGTSGKNKVVAPRELSITMESVGEKLRQARLRLGLTLEAVSSSTRINLKTLTAIEADQLDQISSPFLYKSFVRQIGNAIGLDAQALEQDLLSAAGSMPQPLVPGQNGAPLPSSVAPRHRRNYFSRWVYSIASLGLMLMACSGLYAFWQNARTETPAQLIANAVSFLRLSSPVSPVKRNRLVENKSAVAQRPPVTTPQPPPQSAEEGVFHIQLSAIEQTWLSVVADGKEVYSGVLHTAETKSLEGHDAARIRTGNAGGVEVVFNGRNIGPLGSRGQVRTVLFNRNGYEVLDPQAAGLLSTHMLLVSYYPGR